MAKKPVPDGVFYALGDLWDDNYDSGVIYKVSVWCHKELEHVFWYTCQENIHENVANAYLPATSVIKIAGDQLLYKHRHNRTWYAMTPSKKGEPISWHVDKFLEIRAKYALEKVILNE